MWLDLAALGIGVAAVLVGMVRGTLVSSARLFGALVAYLGAWQLGPLLGGWLEGRFAIAGALAVLVGGLTAFAVLMLAMEIGTAVLRGVDRRMRAGEGRTLPDRVGGAAVSLAAGFAFAVLVAWLAFLVDALRLQGGNDALPSTGGSRFAPVARRVIEGVGGWALSDRGPTGAAVARAASDPVEALERVERLLENPQLVSLKQDAIFWQQVEAGEIEHALSRASFLTLAYDGATRRELADLGLVGEEAATSGRAFRTASADALAAVGPRLRAVREDPALARLAEDPVVRDMVKGNDTLGLLRHPDVRQVLARALARDAADS